MRHRDPRALVYRALFSLIAVTLPFASVACGQPETPRSRAGVVSTVTTLDFSAFTATISHPPSAIAATQTAFAALPTRLGPDSPPAPKIEATLDLPRPTVNSNVPEKPTAPMPTIQTYDPGRPCIVGTFANGDGRSFSLTTRTADSILVGVVMEVSSARWTTPDGKRPERPCTGPPFFHIATPVRLRVEQVVRGEIIATDVVFEAFGGTIGHDRYFHVDRDNPVIFRAGERVVVFLNNGGVLGRYDIHADGTVVDRYYPYGSTTLPRLLRDIAETGGTSAPISTPVVPQGTP